MPKILKRIAITIFIVIFTSRLSGCATTGSGAEGSESAGLFAFLPLIVIVAVFLLIHHFSKKKWRRDNKQLKLQIDDLTHKISELQKLSENSPSYQRRVSGIYCANCGAELRPNTNFCMKCGKENR